jgi:hypothetical protein
MGIILRRFLEGLECLTTDPMTIDRLARPDDSKNSARRQGTKIIRLIAYTSREIAF